MMGFRNIIPVKEAIADKPAFSLQLDVQRRKVLTEYIVVTVSTFFLHFRVMPKGDQRRGVWHEAEVATLASACIPRYTR